MAQAPARGVSTTINGLRVAIGAIDDGEIRVLILAIEKTPGSGNYSWHLQEMVDLIESERKKGVVHPVRRFLEAFMIKANEVLKDQFGEIDPESRDDLDLLNAMIEREVIIKDNKVIYERDA